MLGATLILGWRGEDSRLQGGTGTAACHDRANYMHDLRACLKMRQPGGSIRMNVTRWH
jgi:hypothetical protein